MSLRGRPGLPALLKREPLLILFALLSAVVYAAFSLWKHRHFQTNFDTAIFDQAVWKYSHFRSPYITVNALNALGDHFSPIVALLAPLYWIWPDPRMLLIAQAVLIAASIVPVFLFARPRIGRVGAYLLAPTYALFWGISAGVGYQFHEFAFAPLLVALVILFADQQRWRQFAVAVVGLLLVKEDMSLLVVFVGFWLLLQKQYRRGLLTVAGALVWYFAVTALIIPAIAGSFSFWRYTAFGADLPSAALNILRHPGLPFHELIDDPQKTKTLSYLFVPFAFLLFSSPLALLCVPLIAEGLYSNQAQDWGMAFHHWLPIAPVLAMAAADGIGNLCRLLHWERRVAWVGAAGAAVMLFGNYQVAQEFPLMSTLNNGGFNGVLNPDERARYAVLKRVPPGRSVITEVSMLPHLSDRNEIYLLGLNAPMPTADYIVANPSALEWPNPVASGTWLNEYGHLYRRMYSNGGWEILRRTSPTPIETQG